MDGPPDDLLSDFLAETRETLDIIAGELVLWEAWPDDRARLDTIFRFVHTVKGSCGFLDLPRLQCLSHAAEDVLAAVRADRRRADAALVSAVLAVIDRIGDLTAAMAAGELPPDGDDHLLIAALAEDAVAAAGPAAGGSPPPPSRAVARSIRLPIELLDRMMAGVSDMVLARNELSRRLRDAGGGAAADVAFERLSLCIGEMRDAITRSRMARIDALFSMLPRMVRDLAGELGKDVAVEIEGSDVELDREMIEMIRDPLTHIVRNAIDHGIEPPEARRAAGKPPRGRLRLSARQSGNQILIEAADDGRGIDDAKLVAKAVAAGVVTADDAARMSPARRLELIFAPGLSTAPEVTEISGRGVGMDIVRANIERLGGTVEVTSRLGHGIRLTMRLPLTLTIIPALTVSAAGHRFAIPRSAIDEIVRARGDAVRLERIGGGAIARIRGMRLPVVDLGSFLGIAGETDREVLIVLRAAGGERYLLAVDAVHDHEELVVKPAAPALMATGIYAGTTLPDNSRPILLLDVAGIAARAGIALGPVRMEEDATPAAAAPTVPALLFRDLDGAERAVRLTLVERIEDVARAAIVETAGPARLAHDGRLTMLTMRGAVTGERVRVLQLNDGDVRHAYAIAAATDVVDLPADFDASELMLRDGRAIRILDAHALFAAAAGESPAAATAPLCLIADADDPWARGVLAPLLGAAGYRVGFVGEDMADDAALVIATTATAAPMEGAAPVLRVRARPQAQDADDASVYRYDRRQLLDAVRAGIAGAGTR